MRIAINLANAVNGDSARRDPHFRPTASLSPWSWPPSPECAFHHQPNDSVVPSRPSRTSYFDQGEVASYGDPIKSASIGPTSPFLILRTSRTLQVCGSANGDLWTVPSVSL